VAAGLYAITAPVRNDVAAAFNFYGRRLDDRLEEIIDTGTESRLSATDRAAHRAMEVPWPGSEQATAHSVRASQWVVARLSLERRQEGINASRRLDSILLLFDNHTPTAPFLFLLPFSVDLAVFTV
jgi:hypothetical protein